MANIRKSFNFRSGLQVDNDNFIVNANGLVGIGTSVPTQYLLNVHGDARITGLTTANNIFLSDGLEVTGVTTVGFITASGGNVAGILTVGQIKVGNSGVVNNLVGFGFTTFISDNGGVGLHTTSKIGINTSISPGVSDPTLNVSGNINVSDDFTVGSGVTLTNTGNAFYSGIITATTFDGNLDAADLTTGTISDARFPTVLPAISGAALTSLNATNISSGTIGTARVPTLNQDTTGTAGGLTGTPDVNLGITTTGLLSATSIGIGTAIPANTFQQRATGATELQVTSDTASASVTVGREPGTANTNNAEFRYGGGAGFPYSTSQSLDLINYGTGNFNYYLSANNSGAAVGDYIWHKGSNNDQLMTLTKGGNLGIGITNPAHLLSVQGISTFTGNAHFDSDVTILGNLSLSIVTATLRGDVQDTASNTVVDVSEKLFLGNVDISSGISTFNNSEITKLGISTPPDASNILSACTNQNDRFHITGDGNVGIKTTSTNTNIELDVNGDIQARHGLVIGPTTAPKCAVDMSGVVDIVADGASRATIAYMIPPRLTTTQRNALTDTGGNSLSSDEAGATIYNVTTNDIQVYNGSSWGSLGSGGGSLGDGFVNAADYGLNASATDGTNVTAINNAITALGTNGGTIFFPGGMFYLNAAISLGNSNNSIRFVGSGHQNYGGGSDAGGTVLRRDADDEFFNITNSRAIHFVGITFKGGAANGNGGNSGISGGNGAIYVLANAGCQGYLIENCVFHGIANCIHFKGLSDSIIRGCRFRNVPSNEGNGACIKLDENGSEVIDQIRIQDCVIDGSPDGSAINTAIDGIAIYNTVSTVYVTNTSAIRLRRSFYSDANWDGNFFYFQNSEAERANEDGFSINGTGNFVTIDNCFSCTNGQGGTGHGINIGASQNSSLNITNPNVRDNSGHGILINGPTNNCSIVNPAIGGNSRGSTGTNHGIVIGTNANNVYISGGKIGGNTDELAGTGIQGRGILIDGATHSNIRIIGANVTGNQNSEGISQNISSGTGNSIQFNAGSTVAIDT